MRAGPEKLAALPAPHTPQPSLPENMPRVAAGSGGEFQALVVVGEGGLES